MICITIRFTLFRRYKHGKSVSCIIKRIRRERLSHRLVGRRIICSAAKKLEDAGHTVDLASPFGGKPEVDVRSISEDFDPDGTYKKKKKQLYESGRADQTMKLEEVDAENYDVILVVGGHGAMFDLAKNVDLHALMNKVYDNGGILAAECHGPSVFAFLKGSDDELLIKGLDVTGYPDEIEPEEVLPLFTIQFRTRTS